MTDTGNLRGKMEIITREDAHKSGRLYYFTGKPCKRGHIAQRYTSTGGCRDCQNWKVIPALSSPNTAVPPTPYIFPTGVDLSPELVSYVHGRVLRDMLPKASREYARLLQQLGDDHTRPTHSTALAIQRLRDAEIAAARERLRGEGWTDAQLDAIVGDLT
jgi:hypothetical protein